MLPACRPNAITQLDQTYFRVFATNSPRTDRTSSVIRLSEVINLSRERGQYSCSARRSRESDPKDAHNDIGLAIVPAPIRLRNHWLGRSLRVLQRYEIASTRSPTNHTLKHHAQHEFTSDTYRYGEEPMVYHLLPDLEQFCPRRGGALSKIVANIMRFDTSGVVACSAADGAWGHEPDRIVVIPELLKYGKIKGRRFLPSWIKGPFFRHIFQPFLSRLKRGDVVWHHNQPYVAAALERSIHLAGAKMIYQAHDPHVPQAARTAFKSFTPDAWVFDSDALRQRYLRLFPQWKSTYILPNGADERLFYPDPAGATRNNAVPAILYVGRLQPEKGVHILLDAVRILQKRKVQVFCKLVGSHFSGGSKPTSYIRSLYRSSPSNVEFAGYLSPTEVAQEFRSADIFCCPSIWLEAFGMVNIEAMACGVPVVASRVGGIPEIAAEGGILLVEPESAVELADGLQKLIENKDLRAKTGAEGLQSFRRRFTWAAIASQHQEITERLI